MNPHHYEALLQKHLETKKIVLKYEHIDSLSKDEFARARNNGFGASDSAKLLNVSPFGDRMELIREKAAETYDEEIGKKVSVRKGSELEPNILNKAEQLLAQTIYNDEETCIHVHKPYNMYGQKEGALNINYDGVLFVNNKVVTSIEAKLVTKYGKKHYTFNKAYLRTQDGVPDISYINEIEKPTAPAINSVNVLTVCTQLAEYYGVPIWYFTQLQQQLMGSDEEFGYLAVLDDDSWEEYIFKIYRQDDLIELLKNTSKPAWAMVTAIRNKNK